MVRGVARLLRGRAGRLPAAARLSCVLALISLQAAPALADYREPYAEALEAAERGAWSEVARLTQAAIAEQPQADRRIRLRGLRFVPYLPHYHLGLARYHLGDCAGALAAWQTSEDQGVIGPSVLSGEYRQREEGRRLCRERLAAQPAEEPAPAAPVAPDPVEVEETVETVEAELRRAQQAAAALAELMKGPLLASGFEDAQLLTAQRHATRLLDAAQSRWAADRDRADLGVLHEAHGTAAAARSALESVLGKAREHLEELAVVEPLRQAAAAYLRGSYQRAYELLTDVELPDPQLRAHAHLLRAAAGYALFVRAGREDDSLLAGARGDARACHALAPELAPDPEFFSPPFIEFFSGK